MEKNNKNIFITLILLTIVMVILGTYAALTWVSSNNTEMTITIGDVAGVFFDTGPNINISDIGPVFDYELDGESTYFTISNYIEEELPINANLKITSISNNLKEESFKYIIMSSIDKENYTIVKEGNFTNVSNNSNIEISQSYILNGLTVQNGTTSSQFEPKNELELYSKQKK